jgi:hypothetical protein
MRRVNEELTGVASALIAPHEGGGIPGFALPGECPEAGSRVKFKPNPVSLAAYGYRPPKMGEEGTVVSILTGGGVAHECHHDLVQVEWDASGGPIGVPLVDLEPVHVVSQE